MEQQKNEEYIEIDLMRLMKAVWRHAVAIVLAAVLCAGVGFSLAYWVVPAKYQASALLYVNNGNFSVGSTSISLSDLSASKTLVSTYIAILKTRLTLNEVIERAGVDYSIGELKSMISASAVNNTEIFEISVTSTDPEEAAHIANTIVEVLPDKISEIINGASVRTVDLAVAPTGKSSPSYTKFAMVGALVGLLFSSGIVVIRELLDDQIHGEEDLLQTYKLPVLAAIPDMLAVQTGKGYGSYYATAGKKDGK